MFPLAKSDFVVEDRRSGGFCRADAVDMQADKRTKKAPPMGPVFYAQWLLTGLAWNRSFPDGAGNDIDRLQAKNPCSIVTPDFDR